MKLNEITTVATNLQETTLQQLQSGSDSHFANRNDINNVRIKQKQYIKYGDNELLVKAKCAGETNDYDTNILFDGVQFAQPGDPQSIKLNDLQVLPLSANLNVKVHCTCPDFRWTFAWQNSNANSLIGNPPAPYHKTTGRPPRNPAKTPGLCKHLVRLSDDLQAEQLFV